MIIIFFNMKNGIKEGWTNNPTISMDHGRESKYPTTYFLFNLKENI